MLVSSSKVLSPCLMKLSLKSSGHTEHLPKASSILTSEVNNNELFTVSSQWKAWQQRIEIGVKQPYSDNKYATDIMEK